MSRHSSTAFTSRLATWIACAAMLMAALAPSITRAIGAGNTAQPLWATICSATGTRLMALDTSPLDDTGSSQRSKAHAADCGYCLLAGGLAPPPAQAAVARLPALTDAPPLSPPYLFAARFAWTVADSRGPPAVS